MRPKRLLLCMGALLAALVLASFTDRRWRRPFLAFAVCAAAAGLILLSWAGHIVPAMICCALVGFGLVLFNTETQVVPVSTADSLNVQRAIDAVRNTRLRGGTDIQHALQVGLQQAAPGADSVRCHVQAPAASPLPARSFPPPAVRCARQSAPASSR